MELEYNKYLRKILKYYKCYIDSDIKENLLVDSLSDARLLYLEKKIYCDSEKAKMIWICKTAAHKFLHAYKFYEKHDMIEHNCDYLSPFDNHLENECSLTEDEFIEIFKEHYNEFEINLLTKHFYYNYKFKEIAEEIPMNPMALYQKYKRILDRLKLILPPKELFYFNLKKDCQIFYFKRDYCM